MDVYEKFLRTLDFSDEEISEQTSQWKGACALLGLTEKDVRFACEEWIPQYWDLTLHGIRKCIAVYIRELINITHFDRYKRKGEKILYCSVPAHTACVYANKLAAGESLHLCSPDHIINTVLNAFFNKKNFIVEDGSTCSNPVCSYCKINRTKVAAQHKGLFVTPDVMWNWGLFCNESPKTEEYIQCIDKSDTWNYVLTTIPKDYSSNKPEIEDEPRVNYLAQQFRCGQDEVTRYTGIAVAEEDVVRSMEIYLDYFDKVERLTELVVRADPQPISGNDLILFSIPSTVCFDSGFELFNQAIDTLLDEVSERVRLEKGPLPKGAPKLACQFIPLCVPWISKAFMDNGVNLSVNTFFAEPAVQKRYFDRDNIYKSAAQQWLCNPSAVNTQNEAEIICRIITQYPLDGVLYGFFSFDKWVGALHKMLVKIAEERTSIPHYYLEANFWTDEQYCLEDCLARIKGIAYKAKINHTISGHYDAKKKATT